MRWNLDLLVLGVGLVACADPSSTREPEVDPVDSLDLPLELEEIATGNVDFLDEDGDDPGWVEIANVSASAVPLGEWQLRGEAGDGLPWRLPDTSLAPGARLVVFLSGKDRRRMAPADDTLGLLSDEARCWSDGLRQPPGRSSCAPWEFPDVVGSLPDGRRAVSASLTLGDNASLGLNWSSALVTVLPPGGGVLDASGRDRLRMRATIPAGQALWIRFCQDRVDCWLGPVVELRGTGTALDTYDVPIAGVGLDFSSYRSLSLEPPYSVLGTYRFTVAEMALYRSERRPHASFALRRKGGVLHLEDTAGRRVRTVPYPAMDPRHSWARQGGRTWGLSGTPSPGEANTGAVATSVLPEPVFETASGFHPGPVVVRLKPVPGGAVRCAPGGALPTVASPDAVDGIRLDSTGVLSCAVFGDAGERGGVVSGLFLVGEDISLPVVSVVADDAALFDPDTGLYVEGPRASALQPHYGANYWSDREIPARLEMFEPGGARLFGATAGIGIYGNWSRAKPKKSISVQFRERYGTRWIDAPLFPRRPDLRRFKGFGLRNNGSNCGLEHLRDALGTSLVAARGLETQSSRHVVVFLNGRYWGIHDLREKLDPDYLDTRFGIDPSQVDLVKNGVEIQAGGLEGWVSTVDWLMGANLTEPSSWERARGLVDADNLSLYLAAEIWAGNCDWPANNLRVWRQRGGPSPWRFMLYDLDGGLGGFCGSSQDMFAFLGDSTGVDEYPNGPRATVFFRRFSANASWKARFVHRLDALLSTDLSATRALAAFDSIESVLASEVGRDAARWGLDPSVLAAQRGSTRTFLARRPAQIHEQMRRWFALGDTATVRVVVQGGRLHLEGLDMGSTYAGTHVQGVPLQLVAKGAGDFAGWSDGVASAEREVVLGPEGLALEASFR